MILCSERNCGMSCCHEELMLHSKTNHPCQLKYFHIPTQQKRNWVTAVNYEMVYLYFILNTFQKTYTIYFCSTHWEHGQFQTLTMLAVAYHSQRHQEIESNFSISETNQKKYLTGLSLPLIGYIASLN